jgi:coenzyme F420 hydrogenase subunit beta
MKAAETVIHLRREEPAKLKNMVPAHVWKLLAPYGISPKDGERK